MNRIFFLLFHIAIALSPTFASDFNTLWNQAFYRDSVKLGDFFEKNNNNNNCDRDAICETKDNLKENLAHKILKYLRGASHQMPHDSKKLNDYLYSLGSLHAICGNNIFQEKNTYDKTPFDDLSIKFSELFSSGSILYPNVLNLLLDNYLALLKTDPDFFIFHLSDNTTPLMHLAFKNSGAYDNVAYRFERKLKKSIDQVDRFGNTAEHWKRARTLGANYPLVLHLLSRDLSNGPLDTNFWLKIVAESTHDFNFNFDSLAFNAALLTLDKTDIKEAFLQRNTARQQKEASQLWQAFLTTRDRLMVSRISELHKDNPGYNDGGYMARQSRSTAIRVLETISRVESSLVYPEGQETTQIIRAKILSTGGTFGMRFDDKATVAEVRIIEEAIKSFVHNVKSEMWPDVAQEIMNAFFVSEYPLATLSIKNRQALYDHQVNCVVFGLYTAFNIHRRYSAEDPFTEIDKLIAGKKALPVPTIKSQARLNEIRKFIALE